MGWPIRVIAADGNLFARSLGKVREGSRARVHMTTYAAVRSFYETHSMTFNNTREGHITRTKAVAAGWLPPLEWDNPDTDRRRAA